MDLAPRWLAPIERRGENAAATSVSDRPPSPARSANRLSPRADPAVTNRFFRVTVVPPEPHTPFTEGHTS